jgi:glucokinase
VDYEVVYGASDNASELGHLVVWMGGPECGCGSRGCLEGIASGSGMERRARLAISEGRYTSLPREGVTGADIARGKDNGDQLSIEIWRDAREALASAVASMMSALSPEVVVVGGGIAARNGEAWVEQVAERARELAFGPNAEATRISGPALGADSVLRGAVALAIEAANVVPA